MMRTRAALSALRWLAAGPGALATRTAERLQLLVAAAALLAARLRDLSDRAGLA